MLPYNASKICRLCLLEDNNMILLDNGGNVNNFAPIHILRATTKLEFRQSKELPDKICTKCYSIVRSYYAFIQICRTSEGTLEPYVHDEVVDDNNADADADALSASPVIDTERNVNNETEDAQNLPVVVDEQIIEDVANRRSVIVRNDSNNESGHEVLQLTDQSQIIPINPRSDKDQSSRTHVANSDVNKLSQNEVQKPIGKNNVNLKGKKKPTKSSKRLKRIGTRKDPQEFMVKLQDHRICCKCKQWRPLHSFESKVYLVCSDCKLLPENQVLTTKIGVSWTSCWCGEIFKSLLKLTNHRKYNCYMALAYKKNFIA